MVLALGVLGLPEGLGSSASADTVRLRAAKQPKKTKARTKKSSSRSKKKKKKAKKTAKRSEPSVKRPMP